MGPSADWAPQDGDRESSPGYVDGGRGQPTPDGWAQVGALAPAPIIISNNINISFLELLLLLLLVLLLIPLMMLQMVYMKLLLRWLRRGGACLPRCSPLIAAMLDDGAVWRCGCCDCSCGW